MMFIDEKCINGDEICIDGQDHVHLAKVLRAKINEKIVVNDEKIVYNVFISEIFKDKTICKIIDKTPIETNILPKIHVYMSATKGDKMELVTKKVTELGAYSITPFESKRSIVKFDEKSKVKKSERLQIIAKEASNQCKSLFITKVNKVLSFSEMCKSIKNHELACVFYEDEKNNGFKETICQKYSEIAIIIGPEGGFEPLEIEKISECGAKVLTLGNRILRAETAPIAVVSAIMYEKGNLT